MDKIRQQVKKEVERLDEKNFPKLANWRRANKDWLIEVVARAKELEPKDEITSILTSYESDLQHI
ncbi:hypothetical protein KJ885_05245 [Patescibacteria group bacterium]|nr:hypothetical protein [Patescibacteria group bacterium]